VLGEIAFSANGSPIGETTVARATVKRSRTQATIEVEIADGQAVDASALAALPDHVREEAIEKLRELQLQVRQPPRARRRLVASERVLLGGAAVAASTRAHTRLTRFSRRALLSIRAGEHTDVTIRLKSVNRDVAESDTPLLDRHPTQEPDTWATCP